MNIIHEDVALVQKISTDDYTIVSSEGKVVVIRRSEDTGQWIREAYSVDIEDLRRLHMDPKLSHVKDEGWTLLAEGSLYTDDDGYEPTEEVFPGFSKWAAMPDGTVLVARSTMHSDDLFGGMHILSDDLKLFITKAICEAERTSEALDEEMSQSEISEEIFESAERALKLLAVLC